MEFDKSGNQIVVRRVKKVEGGHHGGAWKVAFADFATAMMAFFLVLWLLEAATPKQLKAVSGYFNDPSAFNEGGSPYVINMGGSVLDKQNTGTTNSQKPENDAVKGVVIDENTVQDMAAEIDARKLAKLKSQLEARIEQNPELNKYKDQIIMQITRDGLQIQIVDKDSRPMFDSGSDVIKPYMDDILKALADTLRAVPNKISITGHTDAQVFVNNKHYSNWELSADRANAARRVMEKGGVKESQVAQVVGLASSVPYDAANPNDPINRRISILVMNGESAKHLKAQQEGGIPGAENSTLPKDKDFPNPVQNPAPVNPMQELKAIEAQDKAATQSAAGATAPQTTPAPTQTPENTPAAPSDQFPFQQEPPAKVQAKPQAPSQTTAPAAATSSAQETKEQELRDFETLRRTMTRKDAATSVKPTTDNNSGNNKDGDFFQ